VPLVLGFDPLYQLMHEWDAEEAITLAVEKQLRGVFNVAGPSPVPLTTVCEATGRRAVAIPGPLYPMVLGRFGFPYLPDDAIAHVKYPVVIDNKAFVEATGFEPRYSAKQTMEGFRWN
jgi:UDP-glucose 4-epimerase